MRKLINKNTNTQTNKAAEAGKETAGRQSIGSDSWRLDTFWGWVPGSSALKNIEHLTERPGSFQEGEHQREREEKRVRQEGKKDGKLTGKHRGEKRWSQCHNLEVLTGLPIRSCSCIIIKQKDLRFLSGFRVFSSQIGLPSWFRTELASFLQNLRFYNCRPHR